MTSPPEIYYEFLEPETEEPPPAGGGFFKIVLALVIIVVVALVGASTARTLAERLSPSEASGITPGLAVTVEVPAGSSARAIALLLEEEGIVESASEFERAARNAGNADDLQAGRYELVTGTSPDQLVGILVAGPPDLGIYRVTVIEGLRIEEMIEALAEQTPYEFSDLANALSENRVFSPYVPSDPPEGASDLARWEGLLAPDTYEFEATATPEQILQRMASTLTDRVRAIDWSELLDRGLTEYQGIVIASMIEREAKLDEDRPLISSVIVNRLDRGMLLQIDATVIYALGENPGRVAGEALEIDSPYNTYEVEGLPPTPIAGVRLASLQAASAPEATEFLYYVLVDDSGRHGFSETLEEHEEKVDQARADGVLP